MVMVDWEDAVWPVPSFAVTRMMAVDDTGPLSVYAHSRAVAGSPVQPAIAA